MDFKAEREKDFLIFEARTAGQFIQRLGRIARHEKSLLFQTMLSLWYLPMCVTF